jgi:hypothetical protein
VCVQGSNFPHKVLITQMLTALRFRKVAETNFLFASPLWSVCAAELRNFSFSYTTLFGACSIYIEFKIISKMHAL